MLFRSGGVSSSHTRPEVARSVALVPAMKAAIDTSVQHRAHQNVDLDMLFHGAKDRKFVDKEAQKKDEMVVNCLRCIAMDCVQQANSGDLGALLKSLTAVVDAASFSVQDQKNLMALVQSHQGAVADDDDFGAPAAAVYKSHSSSIFDVLEDLKEKAEGQLADLRKAESTTKHNYNMLKQSLEDSINADSKDMDEEKSLKASTEENKAVAEGDLAETVKGQIGRAHV